MDEEYMERFSKYTLLLTINDTALSLLMVIAS